MMILLPETDMSLRQMVEWGAEQLDSAELCFGHGTDNALDEAAYLTAYALEVTPDYGGVDLDRLLSDAEKQKIFELYRQRIETRNRRPT